MSRLMPFIDWLIPLAWAVACACHASNGVASPPDFTQVPIEAKWLVHADFDGIRASTVCQGVLHKAIARWKSLGSRLDQVRQQYGLDLTEKLHDVTIFGSQPGRRDAVLVLRADWAEERFVQKVTTAQNQVLTTAGPYQIHGFDQRNRGRVHPVMAALWQPGTFVFGQSIDDIKLSLDVLDRRRPGLSGPSQMLAASVPTGTILLARMSEVGGSLPVESPLLKQAEQLDFTCGEYSGDWFLHGRARTQSAEAARQMKQVAQGLLAMARLRLAGSADSLKLLDRIELRVEDRNLELDLLAPVREVLQCVDKACEQPARSPGN
jgi:hypothetical protein